MVFSRATDHRQVASSFVLEGKPTQTPNGMSAKLDMALQELKGLGTGVSEMRKTQAEVFQGTLPSYRERLVGKAGKLGLFERLTQIETSVKEEASKVSTLVEKAIDQKERCCQLNREAMGDLQESVKDLPRGLPGGPGPGVRSIMVPSGESPRSGRYGGHRLVGGGCGLCGYRLPLPQGPTAASSIGGGLLFAT